MATISQFTKMTELMNELIQVNMNPVLNFKVSDERCLTQRRFTDVVIKFAVTPDLPEEKGHCGEAHPEDGGHS